MSLEILEDKKLLAVDKDMLKVSLGIELADAKWDEYIEHIIHKATGYVETYTQRTIMLKKLQYTHSNNVLYLPKPHINKIESISSNGELLSESEYKKYHSVDTIVVRLEPKYANNENQVIYWAGYGEKPDDIPATLRNIIFDCSRILFEQGQCLDVQSYGSFTKQVKEVIKETDINRSRYIGLQI